MPAASARCARPRVHGPRAAGGGDATWNIRFFPLHGPFALGMRLRGCSRGRRRHLWLGEWEGRGQSRLSRVAPGVGLPQCLVLRTPVFPGPFPRRAGVVQARTWRPPLGSRERRKSRLVVRNLGGGASVSPPLLPRAGHRRHGGSSRAVVLFLAVGVLRRVCRRGCTGGGLHPRCYSTLRTVLLRFCVFAGQASHAEIDVDTRQSVPRLYPPLGFEMSGSGATWIACPAGAAAGNRPYVRRRADPTGSSLSSPGPGPSWDV